MRWLVLATVVAGWSAAAAPAPPAAGDDRSDAGPAAPRVALDVDPDRATVGQPVDVRLTVDLPSGTRLEPARVGPSLGAFTVLDGEWDEPRTTGDLTRWIWRGTLAAYRTGEQSIPSIALHVDGPAGPVSVSTDPRTVTIVSVLEAEEADPELADLKPPASVPPDFRPLWAGLAVLGGLLALSGVAWWLHRRYGVRLEAVAAPRDPFHRTPPHVWVYAELQKLLEQRLPERGEVERFYRELAWILKRYLGGRYRVELMEQTTAEVPVSLLEAGAPEDAVGQAVAVLADCDGVKFARVSPGPEDWRSSVERVYRIVDGTRPAEAERPAERPAEQAGAA